MGFSTPQDGGNTKEGGASPNFGDTLMRFMQSRYPIMSELGHAAFGGGGGGESAPQPSPAPEAVAPPVAQPQQPDYGQMIDMNAQPKSSGSGGGLSMILKLMGV